MAISFIVFNGNELALKIKQIDFLKNIYRIRLLITDENVRLKNWQESNIVCPLSAIIHYFVILFCGGFQDCNNLKQWRESEHEYVYMWWETERKIDFDQVLITYLEGDFKSTNNQCNQKKKWKQIQSRNLEAGGKWEQIQHCVFVTVTLVWFVGMGWRVEEEYQLTIQISLSQN